MVENDVFITVQKRNLAPKDILPNKDLFAKVEADFETSASRSLTIEKPESQSRINEILEFLAEQNAGLTNSPERLLADELRSDPSKLSQIIRNIYNLTLSGLSSPDQLTRINSKTTAVGYVNAWHQLRKAMAKSP
ncbi:hypothetical protein A2954_01300 [Candidatus Roizmanbacteria bacterium RIFCSPLOWO2_01_FULL_37_12]|uniref:Uncharacterized protein n=1 Tax=Candidatus Roizmanbacteria bacterium RIFCSPLOWO2_01_FULL_37_12 TaxID=1802056 RepID=A0A1F7IGH9_9BACT|nr:MAG: hypothetical protein A3D76_05990 [Candidatus Roizmanbacteria bacterium RIFCSPHIGHO2_02_FULL_37_9b]OGK42461.1 MAG: hypothetical protein A2954_01300 [Candidatus Roizmanbacteria bacterium RIFCSPLOWO2_01_FULL_37_12]